MISNYTELVESIEEELSRSDLRDKIPEWIQQAELALGRFCKLVDGEYVTTGTLAAGSTSINMPNGCKQVHHIYLGTAPNIKNLEIVSWPAYNAVLNNDTSGTARCVAFQGRVGYLAPAQGAETTITIHYYGKPPPLSVEHPTNDLLEMGADVLKAHALIYSAPYLGDDERIGTWNALVAEGRVTLRREYWNAQAGGGPLRIRNDVVGGDQHTRTI